MNKSVELEVPVAGWVLDQVLFDVKFGISVSSETVSLVLSIMLDKSVCHSSNCSEIY